MPNSAIDGNRLDRVERIEHGRAQSLLALDQDAERQADRHRRGERTDRENEMRAGLAPEHVGAGRIFLEDRQFAPDAGPQRQREGRRAERERQEARQRAELQTHDGIGEEDRAAKASTQKPAAGATRAKRSPGGVR